ncbi:MAG: replication-associated recombination protein A [Deltaproteobacteria bacterium]|nr:replication-associated recombination protein A [Deltaproteobacteria bacterium]
MANRIRPSNIEDLIGQPKATAFIKGIFEGLRESAALWGPPGTGKTSIANILRGRARDSFVFLSGVTSGIQEIRQIIQQAKRTEAAPVVFIDEVHRFNKVQQDALLPYVENGTVILIGATTENPSFSIIPPLLSRVRVIVLEPLEPEEIEVILYRAIKTDTWIHSLNKSVSDECIRAISRSAYGDARAALNTLELIMARIDKDQIGLSDLDGLIERPLYHDKAGDAHYDLISAFHKSIRAGDVDASIYWLGRMLEAGEDRLYVIRRMIRIASEDIGNADPNALRMALAAKDAFTTLGSPEGELAIYQVVIYLACAPKSNSTYLTEKKVKRFIETTGMPSVPLALRNAPTRLMKDLGYARGYIYPHDDPGGALRMEYMPEGIPKQILYIPKDAGFEKRIKEILDAREKAKRGWTGSYRGPFDKKSS